MPRCIPVLALLLCALVGGAHEAWAQVAAVAETHETAPPAASEVPPAEAEEEEADRPSLAASAADVLAQADARPALEAQSPPGPPSTPPPRQ